MVTTILLLFFSVERLRILENIERDLNNSLYAAGQAIQELSKDKPSLKQAENHTLTFLETLQSNIIAN